MRIKDKIVVITGASSGIGLATAQVLAQEGAKLILLARRKTRLDDLSQMLWQKYQTQTYLMALDITHAQEVYAAFKNLPQEWQAIDILINNAGLAAGLETIQDGLLDDWEQMIDTNFKGVLYCTKNILPGMIARNQGHIINLGSIAGHQVYPKGAVYCATKMAINAISEGIRLDTLGKNIRVTTISPGAVETEFSMVRFKGDAVRSHAVYAGMQPLQAQDIADSILYCVTRPSHVNINEIFLTPTAQASATLIARTEE